ncbi:MAG: hypothetical protein LBF67_08750 [Prevotellaceae bacterium]|jgi:hypothetical protein|nr:hypothetical protein [Prevotellaceae bacterium]
MKRGPLIFLLANATLGLFARKAPRRSVKQRMRYTAYLLAAGILAFCCCGKDDAIQDTVLPPCDPRLMQQNIMEIKDMETKLYFLIRWPYGDAPAVVIMPDGIGYRQGFGGLNYTDSEGKKISCSICNFPDYALKWNPKNELGEPLGDAMIEGEISVIISGKIYIDKIYTYASEERVEGTLELTSLKRK